MTNPIHIYIIAFLSMLVTANAQEKKILDPVEVEILFDYYKQNGDNSAVTGGEGTEELKNIAPLMSLKIPVSPVANLSIKGGIDSYTSASSGNIDLYSTGASGSESSGKVAASEKDTRKHISIGYAEQFTASELNFNAGYSTEYDVNSINAGIGFSQYFNNKNQRLSIAGNVFIDRWLLIYPGEIRNSTNGSSGSGHGHDHDDRRITSKDNDHDDDDHDDDDDDDDDGGGSSTELSKSDFNTDTRYTYNLNLGFQTVINERTNFAIIADITQQNGLLSTPFHRAYFDDNEDDIEDKTVKAEKLPRERLKVAVGLRLNHFLSSSIITRLYYRYYFDDFGVNAHTVSLEIPIKAGGTFTFYPFVRFYNQTESDYFAPFGEHQIDATYYTSDYDQSAFSSFHRGIGMKIAPPNGLINFSNTFYMKDFQVRFSNYERTNGLKANNITFTTKFILN